MDRKNVITRRTFFSGLGLAAAGAAVFKLTRAIPTPDSDVAHPVPDEPSGDGYRLTEHIKKYYRSTTI